MYIPHFNEEKRVPVMHELMVAHPFATLVTMGASGLFATHLPMALHGEEGEFGTLRAHIARPNAQWKDFDASVDALAIFAGPHHYISPSWYPSKLEGGGVVPTWNYAVVHAYGPLVLHEEPEWLLKHLTQLVDKHEAGSPGPWKVSDAPREYIEAQMRGIVGLELQIRRIEGKWKASQNRGERDRIGVSEALKELNTPESLAMKALVDRR